MEVDSTFILNFIQFLQDQLPSLPPLVITGVKYTVFGKIVIKNKKEIYRVFLLVQLLLLIISPVRPNPVVSNHVFEDNLYFTINEEMNLTVASRIILNTTYPIRDMEFTAESTSSNIEIILTKEYDDLSNLTEVAEIIMNSN